MVAWLVGLGVSAAAQQSRAQPYSDYEQSVIEQGVRERHARLAAHPEGKWVEAIQFELIDVFDERDPVPDWVNLFHARTREKVIDRELLFRRGQRYRQALVDETARNLRQLFQLSLVLLVPLQGSASDRVQVLVITKDVWSLRASWEPQIQQLELIRLHTALTEVNLAGLHQTVAARFGLDPASYYYGFAYENLRVSGSRIRAYASAHLILSRDTGHPEGSFGTLVYQQPLYSLAARWAFTVAVAWRKDIERDYVGSAIQTYDAPATLWNDSIPRVWDRDILYGQYELTRSLGTRYKSDWTIGVELSRALFQPLNLSAYSPLAAAQFEQSIVPVSDQRVSPLGAVRLRTADYLRTLNLETLALQEDISLGHDITLKLYPAWRAVASTRDLLGIEASAGYTLPLGDGLVRMVGLWSTELAGKNRTDGLVRGSLRVATPSLRLGRLIFDSTAIYRYKDYLRSRFILGGNTRLRGFLSDEFKGKDLVSANLEFRSPPVDILSVQLGGALFYDVGDAFDGWQNLCIKQGAGLGARLVFPQLNRAVFRVDWGLPIDANRACDVAHGRALLVSRREPWQGLFLGFRQAFALPETVPSALPEELTR